MPTADVQARTKPLRQGDFATAKCGRVGLVDSEFECDLQPQEIIVVRDKRAEGSEMLGALGRVTRNNNMIEKSTKGNRVKYEISHWACIENCLNE
jgi:hypothetical protein